MSNELPNNLTKDDPVLVSFHLCPFAQRSAILLEQKRQPYQRIDIDLSNKPDWFLTRSPKGKIPILIVNTRDPRFANQDQTIFESSIINEYLDETCGTPLLPSNSLEKATQRAWINYSEDLILEQFNAFCAKDATAAESLIDSLFKKLIAVKPDKNGFFQGDDLSLVDIAYAPLFVRLRWMPEIIQKLTNLAEHDQNAKSLLTWIKNIQHHPAVIATITATFEQDFIDYFSMQNSLLVSQQVA